MSSQSAAQQLGMADIVDRMKDLAKNTGDASRRSRKDRAALRSTFKDLINVVEARPSRSLLACRVRHPLPCGPFKHSAAMQGCLVVWMDAHAAL